MRGAARLLDFAAENAAVEFKRFNLLLLNGTLKEHLAFAGCQELVKLVRAEFPCVCNGDLLNVHFVSSWRDHRSKGDGDGGRFSLIADEETL